MNLTDKLFVEIADLLLTGMVCVIEKKTGKIDSYPKNMDFFDEEENPWEELIEKVEEDWDSYILIDPMPSSESFNMMKSFANKLEECELKVRLINALEKAKPFRNFKNIVDDSGENRQKWFDFQLQENIKWVKMQYESELD
ncbi:UPF0158 family protein [Ancylomarina sp. 16SWW S1-10-2]|uniref:UPF0158 family protein n=1 Tax=Ancylomarina sp. 16SWW S1-10-2 TaxID=2499681 RepID=UPI0012AE1D03|nr:UPF0158 family protein [Ancylomarina sp. 16SWW S1-10-2]MRT93586.1 hypothetical protein [Ancylomarina sp. 16SWW S1-10-2]